MKLFIRSHWWHWKAFTTQIQFPISRFTTCSIQKINIFIKSGYVFISFLYGLVCCLCQNFNLFRSKHTLLKSFLHHLTLDLWEILAASPFGFLTSGQLMAYQEIGAQKPITGFPHYPKLEVPMKLLVSWNGIKQRCDYHSFIWKHFECPQTPK